MDGLLVVKPNDRDLLRNFESALRFGKPILLENVGQELDPALDPVLKVCDIFPDVQSLPFLYVTLLLLCYG